MRYRELGTTGLRVSEIGFGPEWMKGTPEETRAVAEACKTPEELLALAKEEGYELTEEDLSAVSGGERGVWVAKDNCTLCKGACSKLY